MSNRTRLQAQDQIESEDRAVAERQLAGRVAAGGPARPLAPGTRRARRRGAIRPLHPLRQILLVAVSRLRGGRHRRFGDVVRRSALAVALRSSGQVHLACVTAAPAPRGAAGCLFLLSSRNGCAREGRILRGPLSPARRRELYGKTGFCVHSSERRPAGVLRLRNARRGFARTRESGGLHDAIRT